MVGKARHVCYCSIMPDKNNPPAPQNPATKLLEFIRELEAVNIPFNREIALILVKMREQAAIWGT
jgi:hypothetical protein